MALELLEPYTRRVMRLAQPRYLDMVYELSVLAIVIIATIWVYRYNSNRIVETDVNKAYKVNIGKVDSEHHFSAVADSGLRSTEIISQTDDAKNESQRIRLDIEEESGISWQFGTIGLGTPGRPKQAILVNSDSDDDLEELEGTVKSKNVAVGIKSLSKNSDQLSH